MVAVGFAAEAQKRPKYEEVLPVMLTLPPSGALAQLKTYLDEEVQNPSIYLQMAVIYEKRYQEGDAMKDFAYKLGNGKLALEAYERTSQLIDEKTVKRYEAQFFNFGKYDDKGRLSVNYDSLAAKIARSKAELGLFLEFAPAIYTSFTESFSHYDKAHKVFTQILGDYPTFKELYLLFNPKVDTQLEEIKTNYLQFEAAFARYKEASDKYETGYNQKLTVKEIHVYRLEGLESQINFLKEDLQVWNYAKWVDETRAAIAKEIGALRASLLEEDKRLNTRLATVEQEYVAETFEPLAASKAVLFNLRKYDLGSVIEPIFLYKEKKHDLLYQELLSSTLDTSASVEVDRKLFLFGQMINKIRLADSTLLDIRNRNTAENLKKYPDFIQTNYSGIAGINQFANRESEINKQDFQRFVGQLREQLYIKLKPDSTAETITYKKIKIPVQVSKPVVLDSIKGILTTHVVKNFDGSMFLAGLLRNEKDNLLQTFVCGVTSDKKIAWYNDYQLVTDSASGQKAHTRMGVMQLVPGGLAMILHGEDTSKVHFNHLLIVDERGLSTLSQRLLFNAFPRTLNFSQRQNALIAAFKGVDFQMDILRETELVVASLSVVGDLNWQMRMPFKGDIASVMEVDEGFILAGNYNLMKGMDGKMKRGGRSAEETNPYLIRLNETGVVQNIRFIDYASGLVVNRGYRVSDDCINIFGVKGFHFYSPVVQSNPDLAFHLIVNSRLEVIDNSL